MGNAARVLTDLESSLLRCDQCGYPFATLRNGKLVIQSNHHGEKHYNSLTVEELENIARRLREPPG